jgi:hypothetical protein
MRIIQCYAFEKNRPIVCRGGALFGGVAIDSWRRKMP